MGSTYQAPLAFLGQMVRWKAHPGSEGGSPALVTSTGTQCVGLLVFHPGVVGGLPYDGVLHESDPKFEPARNGDRGVWAYTEEQEDYIAFDFLSNPLKKE